MIQPMHSLEHEGLNIQTILSADTATLRWHGHCEIRTPEAVLNPFFKSIMPLLKGKKLVLDFRLFKYMSSATQAPILQFLKSLDRNQIPTQVIYNSGLEWQRISYRCMKVLFRAMPQIQFECVEVPATST